MTEQLNENTPLERKLVPMNMELEPVAQGRSLIAVIGINEYAHWQKLKNAVQDAVGLQQTLIDKLGFSAPIPPLVNEGATKTAITSLIEDQLREELQEDDNLILFFAGHGHTRIDKVGGKVVGETGFIVPVEGRGPKEVWSDYIQIDPLLQSISKLPARHILVIIDSCYSGFALGAAMKSFRDAVRYEKDLSSRISRKVITSVRREQLALDGGPVPGYSLFTGTLVDGLNWGKADFDGNGLITSSELGLFLQQQVGQASESKQTPDFGSFYLDDRGEMVISLRDQSFDQLKARAFSALQNGKRTLFKECVEKILVLRPSSPEALYLGYRLALYERDFSHAIQFVEDLLNLEFSAGVIPISENEIYLIHRHLLRLSPVLEIEDNNFPLEVKLLTGRDKKKLKCAQAQTIGEIRSYRIEYQSYIQFSIKNSTQETIFVFLVSIDSNGGVELMRLWQDYKILSDGLQPGSTANSYPFIQDEPNCLNEYRLLWSTENINSLLFPPSPDVPDEDLKICHEDLKKIKGVKSFAYGTFSSI